MLVLVLQADQLTKGIALKRNCKYTVIGIEWRKSDRLTFSKKKEASEVFWKVLSIDSNKSDNKCGWYFTIFFVLLLSAWH